MKPKKQNKTQTGEGEKEGNTFEKFEVEVRNSIFNVLYVLLKDDDNSHWKHIILILIDYIQIWSFSFAPGFLFPWKGGKAQDIWLQFLCFFQVTYWYTKVDFTTFTAIFYILVFIVFLILLDIAYVSYSYSKKKFSFVWPLQVLRSACYLIVTALFIPFIETFSSVMYCAPMEEITASAGARFLQDVTPPSMPDIVPSPVVAAGAEFLVLFPEIQCWNGTHIIHFAIGIIFSVIFVAICLIVSLTFYDSNSASHDISARVNSRSDFYIVVMKMILSYVYLVMQGNPRFHWFFIVLLNVLSIIAYTNFRNKWPYYNDKMNKYLSVMTGILVWGNIVLIITKIFEDSLFDGGLQIYFLGLPLVIFLVILEKDTRGEVLGKNITNFQRGEEVSLQVRYFLNLVKTKDTDKKNNILLKGYIFQHEDQCLNTDCHLRLYKQSIQQNKKGSNSLKKHIQKAQNLDQYQLLMQHAQYIFKQGLLKFPGYISLKIQYAIFLMECMHKKADAISQLLAAEKMDLQFDEKFLIFRYKKLFEDYGENIGEGHGGGGGGLDIVSKSAYEASFKSCQSHIIKSAQLHLSFWNQLMDDRPDIAKLNECGSKINQSVLMVENYWNQLQKLNSNVPKALRMYARFLIEILNDKEGGQELIARSKDAANVKQNFYDANNLQEDVNDIQAISLNGTPCIYISGETNRIGLIQNCNSGASRIFGYTPNEMKNHNVEKLMPEMYAKNHSKILEEALAKGAENIPNKERLVFARHKSGYIFPVWLQLKMVSGTANGIQFVALFKIDKKLITSDIAYILINKDKKLQGLSSSCMPLMNLDISKMRKLSSSGINITKLAPKLFRDNVIEGQYQSKQGGILEWYLPEFGASRKELVKIQKVNPDSLMKDGEIYRTIQISKKEQIFKCHISPILMGYLGEIGWYLKLDSFTDPNQRVPKARKEQEKVKQPLFQFRFDDKTGKFVRELRDNIQIDNACKDPNFQNGLWNQMITPNGDDNKDLDVASQDSDDTQGNGQLSPTPAKEPILEISPHIEIDIMEKKRQWGMKVETYRLQDGKFVQADYDDEMKRQKQMEEQRKRKEEEKNQASNYDGLKNNIKSRKALQAAINNKSVPGAITNLRVTMNLVILCLLALSITEFVVINNQFTGINENFRLITYARNRIAQTQRIIYNTRTLVLINEKKLTNFGLYTTQTDFVKYLQSDMETALDSIYQIQNNISLSTLSVSEGNRKLIEEKSVNLQFKDSQNSVKTLQFSLTDAVLQVASSVFSVKYMDVSQFTNTQQDVFFIIQNGFNDFLIAMRKSARFYMEDLQIRTEEKNQFIHILFYCSISVVVLAIAILCPVVGKVNLERMKILSLFVDIPNSHVTALATKCEDFITKCQEEDQNDEIDMEDNDIKIDDSDVTKQVSKKRNAMKQPKNSVTSNSKVFFQFIIAAMVIIGYFVAMFLVSTIFIQHVKMISQEMNAMAQAESYYTIAQNVQRELVYNPSTKILNTTSDVVARDTLQQLYGLNSEIILIHTANQYIIEESYSTMFEQVYKGNLCETDFIETDLLPYDCKTYLSAAPTHGLQTILVKYFETMREQLSAYYRLKEAGSPTDPQLNSQFFADLYIIQFRFISQAFRKLVQGLWAYVNNEFQEKINSRMAGFVTFVVGLVVAYLIWWLPFITQLNREIWRTKAMLTIIPIEVIMKIPRIQQFLLHQSYFQKKKED